MNYLKEDWLLNHSNDTLEYIDTERNYCLISIDDIKDYKAIYKNDTDAIDIYGSYIDIDSYIIDQSEKIVHHDSTLS